MTDSIERRLMRMEAAIEQFGYPSQAGTTPPPPDAATTRYYAVGSSEGGGAGAWLNFENYTTTTVDGKSFTIYADAAMAYDKPGSEDFYTLYSGFTAHVKFRSIGNPVTGYEADGIMRATELYTDYEYNRIGDHGNPTVKAATIGMNNMLAGGLFFLTLDNIRWEIQLDNLDNTSSSLDFGFTGLNIFTNPGVDQEESASIDSQLEMNTGI